MDAKTDQQGRAPHDGAIDTRPIVVDLDGTLIRTDLLMESVFALLQRNIFYIFLVVLWLLKGKARLKHEIAIRVDFDASSLPYNEELLGYLRDEHAAGRELILATASNKKFADAIAVHLPIFTGVLASDETTNVSGKCKLERIRDFVGDREFDYAANAMVDVPVWESSSFAILVNPERGVLQVAHQRFHVARVFEDDLGNVILRYVKALRIHQWLKNLLVFVPLLMAHRYDEPDLIGHALLAFLAFGLCASSVYLLNDLLDLPDDRQHPTKKYRPFAAGSVSILNGTLLIPVLLVGAFAVASFLPLTFVGILAFYYVVTLTYSLRLKRVALLDVLILAGLYTIRIIGGAAAVSVELSFWLLAFSMFLFLSMALVKRFTELYTLQQQNRTTSCGRGYGVRDLETLAQFGSASAYMAVLVLALYINSETVRGLYKYPEIIWLLCPLLLYIVTRVWLLGRRNELHEDPVVFLMRDRQSQCLLGVGLVLLWLAI